MESTLSYMFNESMRREKRVVKTLYSNESFNCFFRKSNDNQDTKDTMIMYYGVDAPVSAGSLLSFEGKTYLVLNKETVENNVYNKSAVIRTNGVINTNSLTVFGLPFYCDGVSDATQTNSTHVSLIDGNMEILTEACNDSHMIAINDTFNEWGRSWKITNIFYIDGMCHIICEVTEDIVVEFNYVLDLTELSALSAAPGESASITATAYVNNSIVDATILYASSDPEVATIDSNGMISYLAEGEVYFTATWTEHSITEQTDTVSVIGEVDGDALELYVQSMPELDYARPEDIAYYVTRCGVKVTDIPISFKVEGLSTALTKKVVITVNADTISIDLKSSSLVGMTFELVAYNDEYALEHRQSIEVYSSF